MSDFERSPASRALDSLIAEAKEHDVPSVPGDPKSRSTAAPDIDWARLEARLMASVETEKPTLLRDVQRAARAPSRSRDGMLRGAALVLAAAAAVIVFVRRDRDAALVDPAALSADNAPASSLRSTEGTGEVHVGGIVVTPGYVTHASDSIEVQGARATFERARKVTWLLEQDGPADAEPGVVPKGAASARAYVKSAGEPLVLGLEHGVIEAQVVPVPTGEAFAVDIATAHSLVRVAVHGTHLRVTRTGDHVIVDLSEGVVSIGAPPRTGVTYGTIVTAPAHVELDATDLSTLRVDHTPASVRPAIQLGAHEAVAAARTDTSSPAPAAPPPAGVDPNKGTVVRPTNTPSTKVDPPKTLQLPPREAIAAAVRDCAVARGKSGDVHVTISSNLRLRVSAAGVVESAQFSPPLLPDIQSCAAQMIFKTKLDETGLVTVPIELSY